MKTALVTGASSGIGRETARILRERGWRVIGAVRDPSKTEGEARRLDLSSLREVKRFADEFRASEPSLDVLVNNAGFHTAHRVLTPDGHESTFAVNHLAHFLLTRELLPILRDRVVTVASDAHRGGSLATLLDDPDAERSWNGLRAYSNSKLANVLFAKELARRVEGTGRFSYAVHPGSVRTGWARGRESGVFRLGVALASPFLLSPAKGAESTVTAATAEGIPNGAYVRRSGVTEPSKDARDPAAARRLWEISERMVDDALRD